MNTTVRIEGKDGLVRDMSTRAIINTNTSEYQNYLLRKAALESKNRQLEEQSIEINNIKADISELKQLILSLADKIQR